MTQSPIDEPPAWITTIAGVPYFQTEHGVAWHPIGQNDSVAWPDLAGLFGRRDLPGVEAHLRWLKSQGVTCLRLMLEYAQGDHRYFERPVGVFAAGMVQLWDDLFTLLQRVGLHVLLTPFDTFFMWDRWRRHPYNQANGGPCADRSQMLTCAATRTAIKRRLAFASRRWGASPALFAWDLWNEMHPAYGGDDPDSLAPFISDVSGWLRAFELAEHGRAHLQTVSVFGPELLRHPQLCEPIFRHPQLDFANTHLYEHGTIDDPRNTIDAAIAVGRLMRDAVLQAGAGRAVFDSEHGPIHSFKDRHVTLPEPFDDDYFRHIQWAHLASGGAGGGMRWPNRHPHVLTRGMRAAQQRLAAFVNLIDWPSFSRRNLNAEIRVSDPGVVAFGCGDAHQAVVWLLRTEIRSAARAITLQVPGLIHGRYTITAFATKPGHDSHQWELAAANGQLAISASVADDLALAISPSARRPPGPERCVR